MIHEGTISHPERLQHGVIRRSKIWTVYVRACDVDDPVMRCQVGVVLLRLLKARVKFHSANV
jgi:hypothetical protein